MYLLKYEVLLIKLRVLYVYKVGGNTSRRRETDGLFCCASQIGVYG